MRLLSLCAHRNWLSDEQLAGLLSAPSSDATDPPALHLALAHPEAVSAYLGGVTDLMASRPGLRAHALELLAGRDRRQMSVLDAALVSQTATRTVRACMGAWARALRTGVVNQTQFSQLAASPELRMASPQDRRVVRTALHDLRDDGLVSVNLVRYIGNMVN